MPTIEPQFIIPFAKPSGMTSFTSLWQVKRALGTKKVGHTGTLDRFADGLLVLLSGKLTKLVPYITDFDKTYRVLFYFGKETDTDFIAAIRQLTGTIEQVPPVYSAVKQAGERLSDKIRCGEAVTVSPRTVIIYGIDIEEVFYAPEDDTAGSGFPKNWLETGVKKSEADVAALSSAQNGLGAEKAEMSAVQKVFGAILCVHCSKGTYIRSLVRDIAHRCGSAAYVYALRRTAVGPFTLEQAAGFSTLPPFGSAAAYAVDTDPTTALSGYADLNGARRDGEDVKSNPASERLPITENMTATVTEEEVKRAALPLSEEIARAMHFQTAALHQNYYPAFMNGKPICGRWFTSAQPLSDGGTIAVFYKGYCAGLITKNGNRFHYQIVFNRGSANASDA